MNAVMFRFSCTVLATVALPFVFAGGAHANLILFPGSSSEIVDGGLGDATGVVNGIIVVDPASPVEVPGSNGELWFSGMVEHDISGGITVGQAVGLRALRVTEPPVGSGWAGAGQPAVLQYTGAGSFSLAAPVDWVEYQYATLDPGGGSNMTELFLHVQGNLDTTPSGGTLSGADQRLEVSFRASSLWDHDAGVADFPRTVYWENPGVTAAPLTASGWDASPGDYDTIPGRLLLTLEGLSLEAGEHFEFPTSIAGGVGEIIPEPSSYVMLSLGAALLFWWRRRR